MPKLPEQADFDTATHDISLHDFDKQEFSDRGRADIKIRPNDPRFADNPMRDERRQMLDEVHIGQTQIDLVHEMLSRIGVSDQQIKGGVQLTAVGLHKLAAKLGVSPQDVKLYINSLVQQLRDAEENSMETLTERYYAYLGAGQPERPFEGRTYSYEPDALGSVTIRNNTTGQSKFVQGADANQLLSRLKTAGEANEDTVLAPLMEAEGDSEDGFGDEIKADSGTYNFLWKLGGRHGTGTASFNAKGPHLRVVDVRDDSGMEIPITPPLHHALLQQARDFLGKE